MKPLAFTAAFLAGFALASCTNAAPCSVCPPLAGTYAVSWKRALQVSEGCPLSGPQPVTLTFSQAGSTASTLVNGIELQGSVYDTYDFSLSGTGVVGGYVLRGTVIPTDAATDAGVRVIGNLTSRTENCELREDYAGDKISN
ncbi:MAG: hypothetical protein AMXMBFR34_40220 [Myxococcaceae bacterium]